MYTDSERRLFGDAGFIWRPRWFLINRFLAAAGVFAALAVAKYVFHIETIRYSAILYLAGLLLTVNIAYCAWYRSNSPNGKHSHGLNRNRLILFTMAQVNVDLIILTLMLHFSGGATNPFSFYYFFHTILSSILLPARLAYLEAFTAALLFCVMTVSEGTGILRHYDLVVSGIHQHPVFIAGVCTALSSALLIAVYMAAAIMNRLRARQAELVRALEETARLENEKSHFMNVVAHDLKSPVASIETMVTSILSVYGGELSPKARQVLERIPVRTQELLRFIRELLDYSKIEHYDGKQFPFEPVDLESVISGATDLHLQPARIKNISLRVNSASGVPPVAGNPELLGHAAENLISNALRYTPEGGEVTVDIRSEKNAVILEVADTGIGIPEDDIPHIFDDFFRAGNARKFTSGGTGLGLSITRGIVEKHGGTIVVRSRPGEGTVFTVKLPPAPSNLS
ncbi:MAG: sensor histidine kinase [Candidatus Latescibacterota bacterium]